MNETMSASEYKKRVKKKRGRPEEKLQIECNHECVRLSKKYQFLWFHVPNGGNRSITEAIRFKQMGVRPGVYDFCIVRDHLPAAFIELKVGKGSRSASQIDFATEVEELGSPTAEARTVKEFREILIKMLTEL